MKIVAEAQKSDGVIHPKYEVEIICSNCGYDVDESEFELDSCSDCGEPLNLRQNTKIYATSIPAAGGSTLV